MKIAIYQAQGRPTRVDENLETMRQAALRAADQQAQLIIFPEMFLTGYNIGEAVFKLAEPSGGPAAKKAIPRLEELSKDADLRVKLAAAKALQEEAFAQELADPDGWRELGELFEDHGAIEVAQECREEARVG